MLNINYNSGFKRSEMFAATATSTVPKSMAYIDCKYGKICYKFLSSPPSYTLKYKHIEIDIDYMFDDYDRGYVLKAGIYNGDQIIGFKTSGCFDLKNGLIEMCEDIISEMETKNGSY